MFVGALSSLQLFLTFSLQRSILGSCPPGVPLMSSKSRYTRFMEMLSPEQQAALGVVQDALQEDPDCLEGHKKPTEGKEEKEDA